MSARAILHGVLDLALPPTCITCGEASLDGASSLGLCGRCRAELDAIVSAPACPKCGRTVGPYATCAACRDHAPPFSAAVRIGRYDGPLGHLIRAVKYRGASYAAPLLADLLLARLHQGGLAETVDVVTAVPLFWWRHYTRGYNQAALLARWLEHRGLSAPRARLLARVRDTRPQVGLSRAARLENVRGAFRVRRPERVRGRRVLLVDDVMTTGATAETCARELLRAGAASVSVAVAAVAEVGGSIARA